MRIKLLIAAAVAVILSATAVTVASAGGDASSDDNNAAVITLFSTQEDFTFIDVDKSGGMTPTIGDEVVFTDLLWDHSGGHQVGTDAVACTAMKVTSSAETDQCVATFSLTDRGQITVQGLVVLPPGDETGAKFDLAVTGGTGEFADADGQLTVEILNSKGDANLTFDLGD